MKDEILTYLEMCGRERMSLQRGMNFRQPPAIGIILMSRRPNAPYDDELSPDESVLIYQGHDIPRTNLIRDPKTVDQPRYSASGRPTENGKFADWIDKQKSGTVSQATFRVYEKMRQGIWTDRGIYSLEDYDYVLESGRRVFKFTLQQATFDSRDHDVSEDVYLSANRQIPSSIKQEVYKRDRGRCVICGSIDQLHFDHDLPFSRGGTSVIADNVRILCARHNLKKSNRIE